MKVYELITRLRELSPEALVLVQKVNPDGHLDALKPIVDVRPLIKVGDANLNMVNAVAINFDSV